MAIAGMMVQRFGIVRGLVIPFIGGAVLIAALASVVETSVETARGIMFTLGLTVSVGSSGVIALSAIFYPTSMRSAGTGWVMAMGRLGQVFSPLVIGALLALSWNALLVLQVMAAAPLLAGLCLLLAQVFGVMGRSPVPTAVPVQAKKPA
jgi:AAHS family 4-hydroxybenzoate transporter-like MFS transporter